MSIQNYIESFAKGWTSGDLDSILESLTPNFRLGRLPTRSRIPKQVAVNWELDGRKVLERWWFA